MRATRDRGEGQHARQRAELTHGAAPQLQIDAQTHLTIADTWFSEYLVRKVVRACEVAALSDAVSENTAIRLWRHVLYLRWYTEHEDE